MKYWIGYIILAVAILIIAIELFIYYKLSKYEIKTKSQVNNNSTQKKNTFKSVEPIPDIFKNGYNGSDEKFEKDFDLNSYKLPENFMEFCNSKKLYSFGEDEYIIDPIDFEKIIETAKLLILDACDVFLIPPHCIPFAGDESGHGTYCLDYNQCGKQGCPRVICVDNECIDFIDCKNINEYIFNEAEIAKSFEEFINDTKEIQI